MNREQLQTKLNEMKKSLKYRVIVYDTDKGVISVPEFEHPSVYLVLTNSEWFARNGNQTMHSHGDPQSKVLFCQTIRRLFLPIKESTAVYVSPDHPATSNCTFAYVMVYQDCVSAGFVGGKSNGEFKRIRTPFNENTCYCMLDSVMTILARVFPDDVEKLQAFFNLGKTYADGDETVFEE